MKRTATTKNSAPTDDDEARFTAEHWKRAKYRVGGKEVTKAEWAQAARAELEAAGVSLGKKRVSIMLDTVVIDHFKAAAGERGYQTLINEALRRTIAGDQVVEQMRHVVRQELAAYKVK